MLANNELVKNMISIDLAKKCLDLIGCKMNCNDDLSNNLSIDFFKFFEMLLIKINLKLSNFIFFEYIYFERRVFFFLKAFFKNMYISIY